MLEVAFIFSSGFNRDLEALLDNGSGFFTLRVNIYLVDFVGTFRAEEDSADWLLFRRLTDTLDDVVNFCGLSILDLPTSYMDLLRDLLGFDNPFPVAPVLG